MKLLIYTRLNEKFKMPLLKEMAKKPSLIEDVESYEVLKDMTNQKIICKFGCHHDLDMIENCTCKCHYLPIIPQKDLFKHIESCLECRMRYIHLVKHWNRGFKE